MNQSPISASPASKYPDILQKHFSNPPSVRVLIRRMRTLDPATQPRPKRTLKVCDGIVCPLSMKRPVRPRMPGGGERAGSKPAPTRLGIGQHREDNNGDEQKEQQNTQAATGRLRFRGIARSRRLRRHGPGAACPTG